MNNYYPRPQPETLAARQWLYIQIVGAAGVLAGGWLLLCVATAFAP